MKRVLKLLGMLVGLALAAIGILVTVCALRWPPEFPDTPFPQISSSKDPAAIARGEYIVNALAHCTACHGNTDEYMAADVGEFVSPKGGHEWHMGPIGVLRAPNITPDPQTGIGSQSDAELARAIRHGVKSDGKPALFMMGVGPMSDEDLAAVISYLRSIPAVSHDMPDHEIGLLGKVLFQGPMKFFAQPHDYPIPPFVKEGEASVERGRYIAEGPGWCGGCHSDFVVEDDIAFDGQIGSGARNNPFPDESDPDYVFYSPNLTPDPETGHITAWTQEQFMKRFRTGRVYKASPMPWESYRNMTDADLESIWLYLRQLPPTRKKIGETRRKADEKLED
jgi:mono/diheme cytochrome c family protein